MSGRLYRLRRTCGNSVNRFTIGQYNDAAQSIDKVASNFLEGEYTMLVSANSKENLIAVNNILSKLWKWNGGIVPKSHRTYNAVAHTEIYKFGGAGSDKAAHKANRDAAYNIALQFASPDAINENATLGTDGHVKTGEGLDAYVEVVISKEKNPNDDPNNPDDDYITTVSPVGGNRRSEGDPNNGNTTYDDGDDGSGNSWTKWALIGAGVLVLVIIISLVLKKK